MKQSDFDTHDHFTDQELQALKAFYAGTPARRIRELYCNPWPVVARQRALPKDQYEAVCAQLERIPLRERKRNIPVGEVTADDPIYKIGFAIGGGRLRSGKEPRSGESLDEE